MRAHEVANALLKHPPELVCEQYGLTREQLLELLAEYRDTVALPDEERWETAAQCAEAVMRGNADDDLKLKACKVLKELLECRPRQLHRQRLEAVMKLAENL